MVFMNVFNAQIHALDEFQRSATGEVSARRLYHRIVTQEGLAEADYSRVKKGLGLQSRRRGNSFYFTLPSEEEEKHKVAETMINYLSYRYESWEEFWTMLKPVLERKKRELL